MRRAQRRKYHYFYKTTCLITNRFYYGMHSTDNLDDGYLGSGKRLWYSINKYGRENHKIEILEFFETREELKKKEIEVVNEDLLKDAMCMNLQPGGGGGFYSEEHRKKLRQASHNWLLIKWSEEGYRSSMIDKLCKHTIQNHKDGKYKYGNFKGKKHAEETKKKIGISNSISQKGEKNSQYGTCWIYNGKENKKIKTKELDN